jgi:SAM-dependent methyltransferase
MTTGQNIQFEAFCVCVACGGKLQQEADHLTCTSCHTGFSVRNGLAVLLLDPIDQTQRRYRANYDRIAKDDLESPLEQLRSARHRSFIGFIGSLRGQRVLDVGSSNALYLRRLDAEIKVALDIAIEYLDNIPSDSGIVKVCADAEQLPFAAGFFDVVLVSDVLEHLLHPEHFVHRLRTICTHETRVLVHVPWEESLESYQADGYEFSHIRSFSDYNFAELWRDFYPKRSRETIPSLEEPLLFKVQGLIPHAIFRRLTRRYFFDAGAAEQDLAWRRKRMAALPRGEWWLLRFYRPMYKMFELRLRPER